MNKISYAGQVAIVTGSGRGIGRAYAIELAARGASVVVNDLGGVGSAEGAWADGVVNEIRAAGGKAVASYDSVATIEGGQAITDAALREFGTVDVVINNAGFLRRGLFADIPLSHAREIVEVHLLAAFYVTQPAWKVMAAKKYGRVLMTSSAASFGMQANSNYAAAKAGLIGLTSSLAQEGEELGIRVNAVLPYARTMINVDSPSVGPEASRVVRLQQELRPRMSTESVVAAALYLTSPDCKITGQAISALAGRYACTSLTLAKGWLRDTVDGVTVEDFRDHLDRVLDPAGGFAPGSLTGELEELIPRVRAAEGTS